MLKLTITLTQGWAGVGFFEIILFFTMQFSITMHTCQVSDLLKREISRSGTGSLVFINDVTEDDSRRMNLVYRFCQTMYKEIPPTSSASRSPCSKTVTTLPTQPKHSSMGEKLNVLNWQISPLI